MILRRRLLYIGIAIMVISFISATIYAMITWRSISVIPRNPKINIIPTSPLPTPTPDPDKPFSILLLGYGGGVHDGGRLTDSIMLLRVDPKNQTNTLISIPRDLFVPLPLGDSTPTWYKINSAYPFGLDDRQFPHKPPQFTGPAGGGMLAKYIVSQVTGIDVDYFVALDFAGFVKVIDSLGGVSIRLTRSFDDPFYPLDIGTTDPCGKSVEEIAALSATMSGDKLEQMFTCRYEALHFGVGTTLFDGVTALKFARSRHSTIDGGDFNRATRQRLVLEAIKSKVVSLNFLPKIIPTLQTLSRHLQIDMDIATLEKLLSRFSEFSQYPVIQIALTDKNVLINDKTSSGQFVLSPVVGQGDWSQIQSFIASSSSLLKK